jgi:hypothetical protein
MDEGKPLRDLDRAACGGILALSPRGRNPRGGFPWTRTMVWTCVWFPECDREKEQVHHASADHLYEGH